MNIPRLSHGIHAQPIPFAEQATAQPQRILIAEDNDLNRVLAQHILEVHGFAVQAVEDGEKAIKTVRQQPFDLILMDCQMPLVDGLEATRQIRKMETEAGRSKTPIVALSGYSVAEGRERCLAAGMDDYLPKPFTVDQLKEIITKWLPPPGE
jgi:CheY-like chemotaxis protein